MSLAELEKEVQNLTPRELEAFTRWLDEYTADQWDARLEKDFAAGKLDPLGKEADRAFEAGQCSEL